VVSLTVLLVKIAFYTTELSLLWRSCERCRRITNIFNFCDPVRGSFNTFGTKMEEIGYA